MDYYDHLSQQRAKEAAEKKHKAEREEAEYEKDQAERAASRAKQEAEQARRYSQSLRHEFEEEREAYSEELSERADQVRRLKAEKETIIGALRNLVTAWEGDATVGTVEDTLRFLYPAYTEAKELLRLIDLAAMNN